MGTRNPETNSGPGRTSSRAGDRAIKRFRKDRIPAHMKNRQLTRSWYALAAGLVFAILLCGVGEAAQEDAESFACNYVAPQLRYALTGGDPGTTYAVTASSNGCPFVSVPPTDLSPGANGIATGLAVLACCPSGVPDGEITLRFFKNGVEIGSCTKCFTCQGGEDGPPQISASCGGGGVIGVPTLPPWGLALLGLLLPLVGALFLNTDVGRPSGSSPTRS